MVPHSREVVFLTIGRVLTTPNGNRYLECEADCGTLHLWLSPKNEEGLTRLLESSLPLRATVQCLKDCQTPRMYWVPETAPLLLHDQGLSAAAACLPAAGA